jgi:hypothetical protein
VANLQSGGRIEVRKDRVRAIDLHGLAPESRIEEARDGSGLEPNSRRGSASRWAAEGILAPDADGLDGSVPRALGNVSPRARGLLERLAEEEWSGVELTLTLFCAEPTGPLHVRKDRFDYSCLGELKMRHSLDNFLILAEEVLAAFPGLWNREPVEEFLRSLDPARIVRFKKEEVQNLHRWILQWIRIDEEERSAGLTGAAGT